LACWLPRFGSARGLKVTDNTRVIKTAAYIDTNIFIDKTIFAKVIEDPKKIK
jgi:hypothetical protein